MCMVRVGDEIEGEADLLVQRLARLIDQLGPHRLDDFEDGVDLGGAGGRGYHELVERLLVA